MTTVLVVDDHPSFLRAARVMLSAAGYEVVGEALDGDSALREAEALRPDVVLLDIQLPDIDGFEVARRLAGSGDGPRVVLVSNRDSADYGGRLPCADARGFIGKAELSAERLAAVLGA